MGKGYYDRAPRDDRREAGAIMKGRNDGNHRHHYEWKGNSYNSQRRESSLSRNRSFHDNDYNDYRRYEDHRRRSTGSNSNTNYYDDRTRGMNGAGDNRERIDHYRDSKDRRDTIAGNMGGDCNYPPDLKQEHFNDNHRDFNRPQQRDPQRSYNTTADDDDSYRSRYSMREEVLNRNNPTNNHLGNQRGYITRNEHNDRGVEHNELHERQNREEERRSRAKEDEQFHHNHANRIGAPPRVRDGEGGRRGRNERELHPHGQLEQRDLNHCEREPQAMRSESLGLVGDSSNREHSNTSSKATIEKLPQMHNGSHHHQGRQDQGSKIDAKHKRHYSECVDDSSRKGLWIDSPPKKRHREGIDEAPSESGRNATDSKKSTAAQQAGTKSIGCALFVDNANTSAKALVSSGADLKQEQHGREIEGKQKNVSSETGPKQEQHGRKTEDKANNDTKCMGLKQKQHGQETGDKQKQLSKVAPTATTKATTAASTKPNPTVSSKIHSQKQMPAKVKVTNKLGIPMRWLKPKAKPKPVKKTLPPTQNPDTSKSTSIPLKSRLTKKSATNYKPSSPSNRLVTDSSEGSSSIVSSRSNSVGQVAKPASKIHGTKKPKGGSVPEAIVTKHSKKKKAATKFFLSEQEDGSEESGGEWDSDAASDPDESDSSDSDTDEDDVIHWASKVLGVSVNNPSAGAESNRSSDLNNANEHNNFSKPKSPKLKIRLSAALKLKLSESIKSSAANKDLSEEENKKIQAALKKLERKKKRDEKLKAFSEKISDQPDFDHEKVRMEIEEDRRKREEARPLTAKEIRRILREDNSSGGGDTSNWVRRSRRQPSMALLNSKPVRVLVDKLKNNDTDMRVLKMKKYINDPNAPCAVLDAILCAMEENTNCEALYIQNFNDGMRDQQVLHLLRILQQSSCKIWCLNIGENYNVSDETWEEFTKGLIHTKITHMYASEHTITTDMKDEIRFTIRENRKKHDMHINPNNLDVIIQCTHCWWNPINAKVLRPYLKNKGYEHMLKDKEAQGLQGSTSMAPSK